MKVSKKNKQDFELQEFNVELTGKEIVIIVRALNHCDDELVAGDIETLENVSVSTDEIWNLWEQLDKELKEIANE